MKRFIWLPIAGFLLIAGATVAAAAPALVDSARGLLGANQAASGTVNPSDSTVDHPGRDLLAQVLSDLVSQNVISQAQSDAITAALQDKIDQQRADMDTRRTQMQHTMQSLRTFLEDGVITQDEINTLPADNPLRQAFDSIAQNGRVTLEQLRGLGAGFGLGWMRAGHGMHGHGPGGPWFGPDGDIDSNPGASPSPSSGSDS